jgi:FAD/FMN-containing dehydrogenase
MSSAGFRELDSKKLEEMRKKKQVEADYKKFLEETKAAREKAAEEKRVSEELLQDAVKESQKLSKEHGQQKAPKQLLHTMWKIKWLNNEIRLKEIEVKYGKNLSHPLVPVEAREQYAQLLENAEDLQHEINEIFRERKHEH